MKRVQQQRQQQQQKQRQQRIRRRNRGITVRRQLPPKRLTIIG